MIKQAISSAEAALSGLEADIAHQRVEPEQVRAQVLSIGAALRRAAPGATDALRADIDLLERLSTGATLSEAEDEVYERIGNALHDLRTSRLPATAVGLDGDDEHA